MNTYSYGESKENTFTNILEIFNRVVVKQQDSIAVKYKNEKLTYGELDLKAEAVANLIRKYCIERNPVIGVMIERSPESLVTILGILKAGGTFLPLDEKQPQDRIDYILKDSNTELVIKSFGESKICCFNESDGILKINFELLKPVEKESNSIKAEDIAYIIYTSGTTGNPKGVKITHYSLLNFAIWLAEYGDMSEKTKMLHMFSIIFDASIIETFPCLIAGGTIRILTDKEKTDPQLVIDELVEAQSLMIPSFFRAIFDYAKATDRVEVLKKFDRLYLGAEALPRDLMKTIKTCIPEKVKDISNLYGPTECTVAATAYRFSDESDLDNITIGKPIRNTEIHIIQAEVECNVGETGEIYIGGAGVAAGYVNNESLTTERFIYMPQISSSRLYKTGDIGYWLEDGNIKFIGRNDQQVKINGYRIELEEIEQGIRKIDDIKDALVIYNEDENGILFAGFYISDSELDAEGIKKKVQKYIPQYMIPKSIYKIEHFPLTVGGKIDRQKLIEIYGKNEKKDSDESEISAFESVLNVEGISSEDDFFELGGDSIKAIQIVSKLRQIGYELKVRDILEGRKIGKILGKIKDKDKNIEYCQEEINGEFSLSPIQKVFFNIMRINNPNYFNQSYMLESENEIDVEAVKYGLDRIILHHDLLRSVYKEKHQEIMPFSEGTQYGIYTYNFADGDKEAIILNGTEEIEKSIDISTGPLLKVGIFKGQKSSYLFFCIHHLSVDGISWRILIEDFLNAYNGFLKKKETVLPAKSISFKEWSEKLWNYAKSDMLLSEVPYWKEINSKIEYGKFSKENLSNNFTLDMLEGNMDSINTQNMLYDISEAYNTEINDILLTALARAVSKKSNNSTVAINLEGHGREPIHQDAYTDRTVGWFTTEYPVVFENLNQEIESDLINVKETIRSIPNRGMGYIILQNAYPNMFSNIDPDITFNYLGEFGQEGNYGFVISEAKHAKDKDKINAFRTPITINSMIINKKYHMEVTYEKNIFNIEYVSELISIFINELINVIAICKNALDTTKTPSDYGEKVWTYKELEQVKKKYLKSGKTLEALNHLTPMQESMLYFKMSNPDSSEYVVQLELSLNKSVEIDSLYQAINILASRHSALRSNIVFNGVSEPRQAVWDKMEYSENVYDFSTEQNSHENTKKIKKQEVHKKYDFENGQLFGAVVCKEKDTNQLLLTFHHIILDGWSSMLLITELFEIYSKIINKEMILENVSDNIQGEYGKYIVQCPKAGAKEFWSNLLEDYSEQCMITPMGAPDGCSRELVGRVETELGVELNKQIQEFVHNHKLTLNTVMETVWGIILSAYTRKDDVVFGKVVSGRNVDIDGIGNSLGMYINTVPVRMHLTKGKTVLEILRTVQEQSVAINDFDFYSLEEIQQLTPLKNELLGSAISFENYQESSSEQLYEVKQVREMSSFPISFGAQNGNGLKLSFLYDASQYGKDEINLLSKRIVAVLEQILTRPEDNLEQLTFITQEEEGRIEKFNKTESAYPLQSNIAELFAAQVRKTPNNIAIEFGNERMTYEQLKHKADIVAYEIEKAGVDINDIVPIVVKPGIEMAIGIFGVLLAGAAYLPIDPKLPKERIKFMMEQAKTKIILTTHDVSLDNVYDTLFLEDIDSNRTVEYHREFTAAEKAYVIFTSGTTGTPKGVMVTHKNLINHTMWQIESSHYNEDSTMVQTIAFTFDGHASEVFPVLLSGGKLLIADEMQRKDPKELLRLIPNNRITFIPSLLREVIRYAEESGKKQELRKFEKMYVAAEPISKTELINMLGDAQENKMQDIYHFYGPTEAAITTVALNAADYKGKGIIPIGHPIANTKIYILDENRNMCGIGMPGELCIAGESVSVGYLNNTELTEQKFIHVGEDLVYCTGDIAYWDFDGLLHFMGRRDEQIKLRGFRIEVQEIVRTLLNSEGIVDATVFIRKVNNEDAICAYVILKRESTIEQIKKQLEDFLPEYMLPQYYVQLESLPRNINGKVDKTKLPTPTSVYTTNVMPESDIEIRVAKLFEKILGIEKIGVDDSFYSLGGHSLKMTRLSSEIEKEFGKRLSLKLLMEGKTVRRISLLLEKEKKEGICVKNMMMSASPVK
ncbi:non-ribosomal peptide synthetase [Anaerosporobacter sp.]|uniref:non-ribosomal peptide synthetase n=1 Tax=Anaerosporobacter sp. TaxID=1872529 RepID=UPI00286F92D3|nr:non-ribosomal peptide synthetase [Anaerosporobacter sp.]